MRNTQNRIFIPVAVWHTPRGDVELQREINPARMPNNLDELRQLIDADAVEPARRGSFCVQFGGSGHYFDDHADALAYLCKRWRGVSSPNTWRRPAPWRRRASLPPW